MYCAAVTLCCQAAKASIAGPGDPEHAFEMHIYADVPTLQQGSDLYTHCTRRSAFLWCCIALRPVHWTIQICKCAVKICTLEVLCHQVRSASLASLRLLEPLKCGYACCTLRRKLMQDFFPAAMYT